MIHLSDRLELIANRIENGETMADIGTDHGFLPIYLKLSGKSPKVIMGDVSLPSLDKARENADRYAASEDNMYFRAGDGLNILESGEVDTVVIAGMGGKLIRDILAADMAHTCSFKKFVLQPRIGQGYLRKWLCDNGFTITHEDVVKERHHIPEVITVLSPEAEGSFSSLAKAQILGSLQAFDGDDVKWRIPPWMPEAGGPVGDFLAKNIEMAEMKLDNVRKAKQRDISLEKRTEDEITYLKTLKEEWEYGK